MNSVFIHIPKTGGRSIEESLNIRQYRKKRDLRRGTKYQGIITFGHYPLRWVIRRRLFNPEGWFIWTFVRNPYDRAVSLWSFNRLRKYFVGPFSEFCHQLPGMHRNIKSCQADWLMGVDVGFIGRFERLADDFRNLCCILDIGAVKLQHINATKHKPYHEYYTAELADIVYKHWKADFDTFGYERNSVFDR